MKSSKGKWLVLKWLYFQFHVLYVVLYSTDIKQHTTIKLNFERETKTRKGLFFSFLYLLQIISETVFSYILYFHLCRLCGISPNSFFYMCSIRDTILVDNRTVEIACSLRKKKAT